LLVIRAGELVRDGGGRAKDMMAEHLIQGDTPVENVVTRCDTARSIAVPV
jgi:hypothetical protein